MKLFSIIKSHSIVFVSCLLLIIVFCVSCFISKAFADNENVADYEIHYVSIYDSTKKLTIKTAAATVKDVLELTKIELGPYDSVEPSLDSKVDMDNFFINIYRARPVIVSDGDTKIYTMTSNYDFRLIVSDAGLTLYDGDEVKIKNNDKFLETGAAATYEIIRKDGATLTVEEEIPFSETIIKDYAAGAGVTNVTQYGEVGSKQLVYSIKYVDGKEASRELISEKVIREPVERIVVIGANLIERTPLTMGMGRNHYTVEKDDGSVIEREETFYDLPMSKVMGFCGKSSYSVREDGVKVDDEGYVIVAANLDRYPRCSVVETSLGLGKVYDTGGFASKKPEQFDIATDWSNKNGV